MKIRADLSLELQLQKIEKEAVEEEVKRAIAVARRHLRSGKDGRFRGGNALKKLLEQVRLRASEENEWDVVRLVQDSLDYATGRILLPDFEERYRLFQDGARSEKNRNYVSTVISASLSFLEERGSQFLDEHGEATAKELLDQLVSLPEEVRFLDAPDDCPGRYRIVRGRAEMALWLERALRDRVDVEDPAEAAHRLVTSPEALKALAYDEDRRTVLKAAELKQRASSLAEIRTIAEDPSAAEHALQHALQDQHWFFGGRFVSADARRRLVPGDEIDIPLIRADGALHVVELKRAMGASALIKRHRNAWVPTSEVHDAVGQAINYLVGLDENRQRIRDEFGIETRRCERHGPDRPSEATPGRFRGRGQRGTPHAQHAHEPSRSTHLQGTSRQRRALLGRFPSPVTT
ncbi:Shedu anti-phage system protein SduA domain-containing protein [Parasphingorhabdus pacifica]